MDRLVQCFAAPSDESIDAVLRPLFVELRSDNADGSIDFFWQMHTKVAVLPSQAKRVELKGMVLALLLGSPRCQDTRVAKVLGISPESREGLQLQVGLLKLREYCQGVGEDLLPNSAKIVHDVRQILLLV